MPELTPEPGDICRTLNVDKPGTARIPAWKFDLLLGAIRDVLARGPCTFDDLSERVGKGLILAERARRNCRVFRVRRTDSGIERVNDA